jgi:hypothetical protein
MILAMNFFKTIWEKIVINRYVSAGLHWGDATSYGFLGETVNYNSLTQNLKYWEDKYVKLGYIPVRPQRWVESGGYGLEYESQLKKRKEE